MTLKLHIHRWNGCLCTVCGGSRESHHSWEGCTCTTCGERRAEGHQWVECRCSICRMEAHDWDEESGSCLMCGAERRISIWSPVEERELAGTA